jgi:hypothetical protein
VIPGCNHDVQHVGVVFVHGIGSQTPGETLRAWSAAIIRVLADDLVDRALGAPMAARTATIQTDSVIRSDLDPSPSSSRFVELELAESGERWPRRHWILTEAWWADRASPPSFQTMAQWLGPSGALAEVVQTFFPSHRGAPDSNAERGAEAGPSPVRKLARLTLGAYLQALASLLLVLYGALRAVERLIPIGPLRSRALTGPIDRFMLEWFGDVYLLLRDPAQAAGIRGRLRDKVEELVAAGCGRIVLVAHSGGAIVSYTALTDLSQPPLAVDHLITFGQGLDLARRLAGDSKESRARFQRLYSGFRDTGLRWTDFWASQDPASSGPIVQDEIATPAIESHAIWNSLSVRKDHGSYWENDEEFVVPLIRCIDSTDDMDASPLFDAGAGQAAASQRRRRRLGYLAYWRQLAGLAAPAAIMVAFLADSAFTQRVGAWGLGVLGSVPGADIVGNVLSPLRAAALAEGGTVDAFLTTAGGFLLAGLLAGAVLFAVEGAPGLEAVWYGTPIPQAGQAIRFLLRAGALTLVGAAGLKAAGVVSLDPVGGPWIVAGIAAAVALALIAMRVGSAMLRHAGSQAALGWFAALADEGMEWLRSNRQTLGAILFLAAVLVLGARGILAQLGMELPGVVVDIAGAVIILVVTGLVIYRVALLGAALLLSLVVAAAPVIALLRDQRLVELVVGSAIVYLMFWVIGSIGTWQWDSWDRRVRGGSRWLATSSTPDATFGRRFARVYFALAFLVLMLALAFAGVVYDQPIAFGTALVIAVPAVAFAVAVESALDLPHPTT